MRLAVDDFPRMKCGRKGTMTEKEMADILAKEQVTKFGGTVTIAGPRKKKWMGSTPVACDFCGGPLGTEFIDGATIMGPWAIMCPMCHRDKGTGLGVGRGQKYNTATLEKVEG